LKCNTNKCPTGITTQDDVLAAGLVVPDKATRVARFHHKTVATTLEIVGAMGYESAAEVSGKDVLRRMRSHGLRTFDEVYPWLTTPDGALLDGSAHPQLEAIWEGRAHSARMWERAA